jgi:hypothetical protein
MMNHDDALREMSVERYLLGELTGEGRDLFEDHLFDCAECTSDLKAGITLLQTARVELATAAPAKAAVRQAEISWFSRWVLNPAWMVPALAACLAIIVYQSAFQLPRMKEQLAQARMPEVLNSVVLSGGATRGGGIAKIVAPRNGSFLISADIPPMADYAVYSCSLSSASGKVVWQGKVTLEQAKDTVQIRIPTALTEAGENTLTIQGSRTGAGSKAAMETISTQKFDLEVTQ